MFSQLINVCTFLVYYTSCVQRYIAALERNVVMLVMGHVPDGLSSGIAHD